MLRCVQSDQLLDYRLYSVFESLLYRTATGGDRSKVCCFCFGERNYFALYKSTMPV